MAKKLPLGISDFKELREKDCYYVDKTLFLQEVWDSPAEVLVLPRPRRFGKTLNLTMLRHFFEHPENKALFQDTAIADTDTMAQQGRHPVVYLSFKDIKEPNFEGCLNGFRTILAKEYRRHRFLLDGEVLTDAEREEYERILRKDGALNDLQNALVNLTEYLHRATGGRAILLIDEYDTPVLAAHTMGYYDEAIHFIRNLLGTALKDNSHIQKGVLTGILRVARESLFSGLNNVAVRTVLSRDFSDKFGFTEPEVERLLADHGRSERMADARDWYNGYLFGETVIYNPWSIINYALEADGQCRPHWVNVSSDDLIRNLILRGSPDLQAGVETLLAGGSVESRVDEFVTLRNIEQSRDTIFSLFLHGGYLKPVSQRGETDEAIYDLAIPNREVGVFFRKTVLGFLSETTGDERLKRLLDALLAGDVESFEGYLQQLVTGVLSFHDTSEDAERVYHAFVLGLLVNLGGRYHVKSNRESGFGRFDAALIPKNPSDLGVVFEFKRFRPKKDADVEAALTDAAAQMRKKDYASEVRESGAKRVLGLAIVFEGKEVTVLGEEL